MAKKNWGLWILDLDRTWVKIGEFEREAEADRELMKLSQLRDRIYVVRHIGNPPTDERV